MKKILSAALLLAMLAFLLAGCESAPDNEENGDEGMFVNMVNPVTAAGDADELKEKTGVYLSVPEGASDCRYSSIAGSGKSLAQAVFTLGGDEYCLRGKLTEDKGEDISGMYYEWDEPEHLPENAECEIYTNGKQGVCAWYADGVRYSVSMSENASEEKLAAIYRAVTGTEEAPEPESYAFEAQYVRTNGYHDGIEYPAVVVIESREELEKYYADNKDLYDLERRENVYSDSTLGFLDACDRYDDGYFEEKQLIMILLEEPSGSIRHEITDVRRCDGGWAVTVARDVPEVGTADMAEWHLLLEIQMGRMVEPEDTVYVTFGSGTGN